MSPVDATSERLVEVYRRKARHYDVTSRLYPVPGYPQRSQRERTVRTLGLSPGATVVDIACGTGLNFPLLERAVGADGRIVGVDLTDAMLAGARRRIDTHGWRNITLIHADAAAFVPPAGVDGILSTYALTQVPGRASVIANGASALARGGRWAVLDLKLPDGLPAWVLRLGVRLAWTSGSLDEWTARRPWEEIRTAMQESLEDASWTELCLGTAFLATGTRRR